MARVAFADPTLTGAFGLMTLGSILWLPLALGAITVYLAQRAGRPSWALALFLTWFSALASVAVALGWERAIWCVLALPLYLVRASLGGIIVWLGSRHRMPAGSSRRRMVTIAALPLLEAPTSTP